MLDSLTIDTKRMFMATLGDASAAKFDFLHAGRSGNRVGVNRMHCRPFHPHGKKLVEAGLMRLERDGLPSSRHTALVITDKGLEELTRMEKKLAKFLRSIGDREPHPTPLPGQHVYTHPSRGSAIARARRTAAIGFLKARPVIQPG